MDLIEVQVSLGESKLRLQKTTAQQKAPMEWESKAGQQVTFQWLMVSAVVCLWIGTIPKSEVWLVTEPKQKKRIAALRTLMKTEARC